MTFAITLARLREIGARTRERGVELLGGRAAASAYLGFERSDFLAHPHEVRVVGRIDRRLADILRPQGFQSFLRAEHAFTAVGIHRATRVDLGELRFEINAAFTG